MSANPKQQSPIEEKNPAPAPDVDYPTPPHNPGLGETESPAEPIRQPPMPPSLPPSPVFTMTGSRVADNWDQAAFERLLSRYS